MRMEIKFAYRHAAANHATMDAAFQIKHAMLIFMLGRALTRAIIF